MTLLLLLLPNFALAYSGGKTGSSTTGCAACHGGRADSTTTSTFAASATTVLPGEVVSMTLSVSTSSAARTAAGLNVSASGGTLGAGSNTQVLDSEITHIGTTPATSGVTTFDFTWTAPTTEGTYALRGVGNAVNEDAAATGDGWNLARSINIVVDDPCDDADGDGVTTCDGDCNDAEARVNPLETEVCDGLDNDCDGSRDGADAADAATWYSDNDLDGYGDADFATVACEAPYPSSSFAGDCDDTDDGVNPAATEVCDALDVDEDCDGAADDADDSVSGRPTWYLDDDGDGYGGSTSAIACEAPGGYVRLGGDCDDGDTSYNPGAAEVCGDERDLNCDGAVGSVDGDSDGFFACEECNDGDRSVNPAATERCNAVDDDCDGTVDEDDAKDAGTWYLDADGDGRGTPEDTVRACVAPDGRVDNDEDCDDTREDTYEGAREVYYDGVDQACDGGSDYDADGDGHDSADHGGDDCDDTLATTYPGAEDAPYDGVVEDCDPTDEYDVDGDGVEYPTDCADEDETVYPGAEETWYDGVDQDCDGNDDDQDLDGTPVDADCDDTDPSVAAECDTGGDTGGPDDSGTPSDDTGTTDEDKAGGCGCASSSPGTGGWALLAGLAALGLRRRR